MSRWTGIIFGLCLVSGPVRAEVRTDREKVRRQVRVTLTSEGHIVDADLPALRRWIKGCGKKPITYRMELHEKNIDQVGRRLNYILVTIISESGGVVDEFVALVGEDHPWDQVKDNEELMVELSCNVSLKFALDSNGESDHRAETPPIGPPTVVSSHTSTAVRESKMVQPGILPFSFILVASARLEPTYAVDAAVAESIVFADLGVDTRLMPWLIVGLRWGAGASSRSGLHLWNDLNGHVSSEMSDSLTLGFVGQWQHAWLGNEPSRDRFGAGGRALLHGLIPGGVEIEVVVSVSRDLTPAYDVPGGRFTAGNDLTVNLGLGLSYCLAEL